MKSFEQILPEPPFPSEGTHRRASPAIYRQHPFWREIFGNEQPLEVEVGSGTGSFLLDAAAARADVNFFGIERNYGLAMRLQQAIEQRALANARAVAGDAACIIATMVPPASVAAYHIYFPDPWWKRRHHRRRIWTPRFARLLAETLCPGGYVYVATDVETVFVLMKSTLQTRFALAADVESPRRGETTFERKGRARGAPIFTATYAAPGL